MTFSSLRLNIPVYGGHFERTIPLPLRSLVSTTLYESFASEIDALVASNDEQTLSGLLTAGFLLGFVLFGVGGFLSVQDGPYNGNLLIIVGIVMFVGSPILAVTMASSVDQQFTDKIKQICEDYSRRFGTITVHYKEDVSYYRDSDGDSRSRTQLYIEVLYPNDIVPTAETNPVLRGAVVMQSSPLEADNTFLMTATDDNIPMV